MPDDKLNIMNIITKWLGTAFDVLFIRNPVKTAIGVLMGVVLDTISDIIIQLTNVAISIPMYSWIALSVILMNFRSILPRHAIDEELETQMHYIESVQKKGHFSEYEKRQQWRNYISRVYEKAAESIDNHNSGQAATDNDRTIAQ